MQRIQVRPLVGEDPTCCRAAKLKPHSYWACALSLWAITTEARSPESMCCQKRHLYNEKPTHCNQRGAPLTTAREGPHSPQPERSPQSPQPERSPTRHSQRGAPLTTAREEPTVTTAREGAPFTTAREEPQSSQPERGPAYHSQRGAPIITAREEPPSPQPERSSNHHSQRGAPLTTAREKPWGNRDPAQPKINKNKQKPFVALHFLTF